MRIARYSWGLARGFVQRNKAAKAASLLLAILAWYAVRSAISFEEEVKDIPLTIQSDQGWTVLEQSARSVNILFQGAREDIRFLHREDIKVIADIRGQVEDGRITVRLQPKNVMAPGNARVVYISPSEVTLRLDKEVEQQVVVKVEFQGACPDGYEIDKVTCIPATVQLIGPRQQLKDVDTVKTVSVDLEGRIRSFRKVKLALLPPGEGVGARFDPEQVTAEITIMERAAMVDIEDVPVTAMVPAAFRARVDLGGEKVKVSLRGRPEQLKTVDQKDIRAYVDCTELEKPAQYTLPVRVVAPVGTSVAAVEPSSVKVMMRE